MTKREDEGVSGRSREEERVTVCSRPLGRGRKQQKWILFSANESWVSGPPYRSLKTYEVRRSLVLISVRLRAFLCHDLLSTAQRHVCSGRSKTLNCPLVWERMVCVSSNRLVACPGSISYVFTPCVLESVSVTLLKHRTGKLMDRWMDGCRGQSQGFSRGPCSHESHFQGLTSVRGARVSGL